MKQLVLDAGPLIAFFNSKDVDHLTCKAGFEQLLGSGTILLTPIPIVFEVYKWFLQKTNPVKAKAVLAAVRKALTIVTLSQLDIEEIYAMVESLPSWTGSLEDATVIWIAQSYHCRVWTLNYRDFGMFKSVEFWNPKA